LADVFRNTNKDTRLPIYNEDMTNGVKLAKAFSYLWDDLQPGFMASGERIVKGAQHKTEGSREYDLKEEIMALALGVRITRTNPEQSFMYKTNDYKKRISNAQFEYWRVQKNPDKNNEGKTEAAYAMSNEAIKKIIMEAHEDYLAALRLGVPKRKLMEHLRQIGNDYVAGMIIRGTYYPIARETGGWTTSD
jgi:hypothetical protein